MRPTFADGFHAAVSVGILEGGGVHLVEGGEIAMALEDIVFTARDERHGFRNSQDLPARALFGYFGAGRLEDGGYEVHGDVTAAFAGGSGVATS